MGNCKFLLRALLALLQAANLPQPDVSVSCLQAQETCCYGPSILSNFSCAEVLQAAVKQIHTAYDAAWSSCHADGPRNT